MELEEKIGMDREGREETEGKDGKEGNGKGGDGRRVREERRKLTYGRDTYRRNKLTCLLK